MSESEDEDLPSFLLNENLAKDESKVDRKTLKRRIARQRKREAKAAKKNSESADADDEPLRKPTSTENAWNTENIEKLPVKTTSGKIVRPEDLEPKDILRPVSGLVWRKNETREEEIAHHDSNEDDGDESEEDEQVIEDPIESENDAEPHEQVPQNYAQLLLRREQLKVEISDLVSEILANPEEGFGQVKTLGGGCRVKKLIDWCCDKVDPAIQKLSMLSLVVVFKDVLPGYRIRLPTALELKTKVKKETKQLRKFERELLESYQLFLKTVHDTIKSNITLKSTFRHDGESKVVKKGPSVATVGVRALCTMLVAKPSFNFSENLLANIIPLMNSEYADIKDLCCNAIETILCEDVSGDLSLEIVVCVSKYVRSHKNGVGGLIHPDMIRVLSNCKLNADLKDELRAELAKFEKLSKKQKRKKRDDIGLGLEEADAGVNKYTAHAKQVESLRELFTMYLRVLKYSPNSVLLPAVLQGVAKFVHLINLDIAQSLLSVLTDLVRRDALGVESGLHTILTVMKTIQGPGKELKLDESEFVAYFYRMLLKLSTHAADREKLTLLACKCTDAMFLGRKQYQHSRVASFTIRLAVLANFLEPHAALAIVATVRTLMHRYASVCRPLLESEVDAGDLVNSIAVGLPPPLIGDSANLDPVLVQKDSAVLWPLAMLRFHYHPFLREFAVKALEMSPILPTDRPQRLFAAYNPSLGGFNPPVQKTMFTQSQKKQYKNKKSKEAP